MNELTVEQVTSEIAAAVVGQRFGKVFALSRLRLAIDFRLPDSLFLFVSAEPSAPRAHLVRRRLRDLEKASGNPTPFLLGLKKKLSNSIVESVEKTPGERAFVMTLNGIDDFGARTRNAFVVQLTGRSANVFLLDANGFVIDRLRDTSGDGQDVGTRWSPPSRPGERAVAPDDSQFPASPGQSLSEALDEHYLAADAARQFAERVRAARQKITAEIAKREKLLGKLNADLRHHGNAEEWKRRGDLILANLADAVMVDGRLLVVDYFDENVPTVEIEIDENESPTENAERFFKRYTKARNARAEIARRTAEIESELETLRARLVELEAAADRGDDDAVGGFVGEKQVAVRTRAKKEPSFAGARRFVSTDGYEILVGKASKDNDQLTFKVAKSLDLWLHAADYPGSHVVVRNQSRGEIPTRTLLEAARLAAFYSHARQQPKVAVNYTPRKFVNKPKGAAPGLVSLSSFKTILVEPGVPEGLGSQ